MTVVKQHLPQQIRELFNNRQILQLIAVTNRDRVVCYIFPGDDTQTAGLIDEDLYDFNTEESEKDYKPIDPNFSTNYCCRNGQRWCVMTIDGETVRRNTRSSCSASLPICPF